MNKELKPFRLYGQDIDFIINKGGKLENKQDFKDFLNDNLELIQMIFNYEDTLIKLGSGSKDEETINTMLKKLYRNIKTEGCGFDEETYKNDNFYEMPIIEFKKLFD